MAFGISNYLQRFFCRMKALNDATDNFKICTYSKIMSITYSKFHQRNYFKCADSTYFKHYKKQKILFFYIKIYFYCILYDINYIAFSVNISGSKTLLLSLIRKDLRKIRVEDHFLLDISSLWSFRDVSHYIFVILLKIVHNFVQFKWVVLHCYTFIVVQKQLKNKTKIHNGRLFKKLH